MIYESLTDYYRKKYGKENERAYHVLFKSTCAAIIGSSLSNCFDVVSAQKQAYDQLKVVDILKREKWNVFTRGVIP